MFSGGEIQPYPSPDWARQGRRAGSKTDGERKGGTKKSGEEGGWGRSCCRVPCGREADGVSLSLSVSLSFCLPPSLNTKPCTALQKIGVWENPSLSLSLSRSSYFSLSPSLLCSLQTPSHCLFHSPPFWICSPCSVMQNRSNTYCAMPGFKAPANHSIYHMGEETLGINLPDWGWVFSLFLYIAGAQSLAAAHIFSP